MSTTPSNLRIHEVNGTTNLGAALVHAVNQPDPRLKTSRPSTKCGISGIGPLVEWGVAEWTSDTITCIECLSKGAP